MQYQGNYNVDRSRLNKIGKLNINIYSCFWFSASVCEIVRIRIFFFGADDLKPSKLLVIWGGEKDAFELPLFVAVVEVEALDVDDVNVATLFV